MLTVFFSSLPHHRASIISASTGLHPQPSASSCVRSSSSLSRAVWLCSPSQLPIWASRCTVLTSLCSQNSSGTQGLVYFTVEVCQWPVFAQSGGLVTLCITLPTGLISREFLLLKQWEFLLWYKINTVYMKRDGTCHEIVRVKHVIMAGDAVNETSNSTERARCRWTVDNAVITVSMSVK